MRHPVARILLLALPVVFFAALKLYALHPVISDENIYFYLGWRSAEGLFPYRDFVFTHPPLHIHVLTLLAWFSGASFAVMKMAPTVFTLLTGVCLVLLARDKAMRERLPGPFWSVLPALFFCFSYDTLRISSHYVGVNQALFFLIAGALAWTRRRTWVAGVALGAALSTANYLLPLLVALLVIEWPWQGRGRWLELPTFEEIRPLLVTLGVGTAALVTFHLPTWLLAGPEWWEQAVIFHMKKPPVGSTFAAAFRQLMSAEGFLVVASAALLVVWLKEKPTERMAWWPAASLAYIAFFSRFERVYIYYLIPALPFLALGATLYIRHVIVHLRRKHRRRSEPGLAIMLLLALLAQPVAYWTIPDVARAPGERRTYVFTPTPGIGPVNTLLSMLFPETRIIGIPVPGFIRYLWHESRFWREAETLARDVADRLPPDATLYGDSTSTPLVALLSRRRLACDLADTNTMHFRTGLRTIAGDLECARGDNLAMLVTQDRRGLSILDEFQEFVTAEAVDWRQADAGTGTLRLLLWSGSGLDLETP